MDKVVAKGKGRTRSGRGGAITRLVVAGVLLGPCLGIAIGPWLVANRLPLWEARIPWLGPAPVRGDWPRPPGPGESAETRTTGARTMLVARAPTAVGAEVLALELALPRLSRSPELASAGDARRASWAASLLRGPSATLTPAGECAARLRGWATAWRAVAAPPGPPASPQGGTATEPVPARSRETPPPGENDVVRLALAADAPGLENALQREARVARSQLFTKVGSLPAGQREVATDAWRRAWGRRAAELDTLAEALTARKPRIERELIARMAPAYALDAEPRIPDPGVTLLLAASGSQPATARPVAASWILFAALGSALGLVLAWPLARTSIRGRRARNDELTRRSRNAGPAFVAIPPAASVGIEPRLQIVSGPNPRRVAHAARELAARSVAGGERVLVMDGGRDLRLHDSFGAQPHLGFQECMREELPLLGVLQSSGLPGLYVVAHGAPSRLGSWMPLGGLLDQARPHFSRVVLALEANLPRQAGEALAGRLMDGWWAGPDVRARAARRFSTRVGNALQRFEPATAENATLEAMVEGFARRAHGEAASAPAPTVAPAPEIAVASASPIAVASAPEFAVAPAPELADARVTATAEFDAAPVPELAGFETMVSEIVVEATLDPSSALAAQDDAVGEPVREAAPAAASAEAPAFEPGPGLLPAPDFAIAAEPPAPAGIPAGEPVVLESDPEVSERLRFLVWMRRLRDKSRGEVAHAG